MIGGAALLLVMVGNELSSLMENKSSPLCCWTHPARRVKPEISYTPDPRISGPISSIWPKIPGLRAVWERLARRRRNFFGVFPSNGTGKRSRLCTAGWERDGKAGRLTGWDGNYLFPGGTGTVGKLNGRETSRETSWEISRETSRETRRETRRHVGRHRNLFAAFITTAVFLAVGSCTLYV